MDQAFAVTVKKAVIPGSAKTPGQDMLQQQPQELCSGQGACLGLAAVFRIPKGHLTILAAQDILLRQYATVEVTPQVKQRLLAVAHLFAIDDPLLRDLRLHLPATLLHRLKPLPPKHLGQCLLTEQILAFLDPPAIEQGIDGPGGDHDVHMGMEVQCSAMGVKHRRGTQLSSKGLVVESKL